MLQAAGPDFNCWGDIAGKRRFFFPYQSASGTLHIHAKDAFMSEQTGYSAIQRFTRLINIQDPTQNLVGRYIFKSVWLEGRRALA